MKVGRWHFTTLVSDGKHELVAKPEIEPMLDWLYEATKELAQKIAGHEEELLLGSIDELSLIRLDEIVTKELIKRGLKR